MRTIIASLAGRAAAAHLLVLAAAILAQPPSHSGPKAAESGILSVRQSIDAGHPDQALQQIATLRAASGPLAGLTRMEALALYQKGDLRSADKAFAAALKEDSSDVESAQMRGLTLFRLGRPADAIPLIESARGRTAGQADPNYILALCYMDIRRYDDARHAFAAQFGFALDSAAAYLVTARMLLRREYIPIAQEYAQKSLELDASLPLAYELLGEIALAGNHLDLAIAELEKERRRNPLEGIIYDRLGDAYLRSARYDDAEKTLQQAILLMPNSTGPYILLGKTLLKKSDLLGAATYLERAAQLDPANYMTHSLLGQTYRAMGRTEDASRETATAQKIQSASEPKLQ
jgi:predicted Zn-dependent protease